MSPTTCPLCCGGNPVAAFPSLSNHSSTCGSTAAVQKIEGYHTELVDDAVVIRRDAIMDAGDLAEGIDTGGTPVAVHKITFWAACMVSDGEMLLCDTPDRWRPMWYSLDAARRRYLKRLAIHETPIVEHAPLWELASEWVYAPVQVRTNAGTAIAIGFGQSRDEAFKAALETLTDAAALEEQERERLSSLLTHSWFSCGHFPTDAAYGHVLSRLTDCLTVVDPGDHDHGGQVALLAGDAYFQEAWKRDENIALGGLLATGQYQLAANIIGSNLAGTG